jgi:NAD(P)-dependent dehydrogenase (short-subunit alcohol dehydrogenase family)
MAGDTMTSHPGSPWAIDNKLCLITGATSGIGAATATELARRGAHVLLVARDPARGRAAADAITAVHPDAKLEVLSCDLARLDDVRSLARTVQDSYGRLDVLVNNAEAVNFSRRTTIDGYEHTFAVNHLAPFLLTNLLRPALAVPDQARVLTVTSDNHKTVHSVPWDDLQSEHGYKPLQAYNRTKLMNIWFTQALATTLANTAITANCASPGFVRTRLARDATGFFAVFIQLAAPFQSSPKTAAATLVHLATAPEMFGQTGGYYRKSRRAEPGGLAAEPKAASRLWQISAELTGLLMPRAEQLGILDNRHT